MSHTSLYGLNIGQKPLDLIQTVKKSAMYYWESLLPACGIDIPAKGKHGACPVCGGTDRFHFIDDHHNGNWHCRQCENPKYGDGLDLVARTKGISITEAAKVIADVLALPLPDQTRYVGDGSGIKAITGGDEVSIDPKHKQPYSTRIPAVVLAVNNNAMSFSDRSGGVSRRRVIFNFSEVVPEHERDPFLRDKIAEELPVIIQHLLHRFSDPKEARRLLAEQQKSEEALTIKRGTDSLVDFCGYLMRLMKLMAC
ncbi:protein of unknown function [Xenorhabdus nematophila AN6/1]|nr:protein of unknown function [Xenorhabdus nematophila AN6/1]